MRFRPWLCPGPRWESLRRSPKPPSRLRREQPSLRPAFGARHASPKNSSQIYAYESNLDILKTYLHIKHELFRSKLSKVRALQAGRPAYIQRDETKDFTALITMQIILKIRGQNVTVRCNLSQSHFKRNPKHPEFSRSCCHQSSQTSHYFYAHSRHKEY